MSDCCTPKGYRTIFSEKNAQSEVERYRSKGLDRLSRRIADLVKEQGVDGMTMLEVGGGIGAIEIELLKAGVTSAVNVELTPTCEEAAGELLRETGLADRVEGRVMDLVEIGADVEAADFVVLNRGICCYPDMPRLTAAAAERVRHTLVLTFPNSRWWTRIGLTIINFGFSCREAAVPDLPTSPGADPGGGRETPLEDHPQPPGPPVAGDRTGQDRLAARDAAPTRPWWGLGKESRAGASATGRSSDQSTYPGGDRHREPPSQANPQGRARHRRTAGTSACDPKHDQSKQSAHNHRRSPR